MSRSIACVGCGAIVPDIDGSTHAYIGASPGCWNVYTDVLGREYGEYGYPECHRLTVDAYAVQHPGTESRRAIQSVTAHLVGLHLVIEQGMSAALATQHIRRALRDATRFRWLDQPSEPGVVTVHDVAATTGVEAHERAVRRWAESVWMAWSEHHPTVREWAGSP